MKSKKFSLWLPVFLWCGFIFYLSSLSIKPPTGTWLDIVLPYITHLGEYGVLFTLVWRASKNLYFSIIFIIGYAFSDEIHQAFVPTRTPDLIDIVTDIIGMALAWLTIWKWLPKAPKKLLDWAKNWQIL